MMDHDVSTMLADQLDRLLAARVTPSVIAAHERGEGDSGVAQAIAELGLEMALVPEGSGGAGLCWRDVGPMLKTLGYHAAPCDLGEQIIANRLLADLGQKPSDGPIGFGLDAVTRRGDAVEGTVTVPGGVSGQPVFVLDGQGTQYLVDSSEAAFAPLRSVGRTPGMMLTLTGARVIASAAAVAADHLTLLAVLRAAQIAGALSRLLELCIEQATTREQFGRPIGKFQAVQHLVAELAAEAGAASAGVDLALAGLDADAGWEPVAVAKIRASRAVARSADVAHQVHGAIGVTQEHMLHNYTRRLWQWRDEAGSEHDWSERLGAAAIGRGADRLWPSVVDLAGG